MIGVFQSPFWLVETSVNVTPNSPSQDYTHPDDHNLRTYDMTRGFKSFTVCRVLIYSLGDIAFIKNKTSPNLITVHEGGQLILRCSYCTVSPLTASLSWHKEGLVISNDSRHVVQKDELGIPGVEHSRDEGLYECVVTSKNKNISRFITVIVTKGRINYNDLLTIYLTLMMTFSQVVETSVNVTSNRPSQDNTHPDDHNLLTKQISF